MGMVVQGRFVPELFRFFKDLNLWPILMKITGEHIRKMVRAHIYLGIYLLRILTGISSNRGMESLLREPGIMRLLGFSTDTLCHGLCQRGKANQHGQGFKKNTYFGAIYRHPQSGAMSPGSHGTDFQPLHPRIANLFEKHDICLGLHDH